MLLRLQVYTRIRVTIAILSMIVAPVAATGNSAIDDIFADYFDQPVVSQPQQPVRPVTLDDLFDDILPQAPQQQAAPRQQQALDDLFDDMFAAPAAAGEAPAVSEDGIYVMLQPCLPQQKDIDALMPLARAYQDNYAPGYQPGALVRRHATADNCFCVGPLTEPAAERLIATERGLHLMLLPSGETVYFLVAAGRTAETPALQFPHYQARKAKNPASLPIYQQVEVRRQYNLRRNRVTSAASRLIWPAAAALYEPGSLRTFLQRLYA